MSNVYAVSIVHCTLYSFFANSNPHDQKGYGEHQFPRIANHIDNLLYYMTYVTRKIEEVKNGQTRKFYCVFSIQIGHSK